MEFVFEERPFESPIIERIWRTQSDTAGKFMSQSSSQWEMVVWKYQGQQAITVRGPEVNASLAESPADSEFFGISFKLGTFMPHMPLSMLVNQGIDLPEAGSSQSFWLNSSAWEMPNFDNADTFVDRLVRQGLLMHEPLVAEVLQGQTPDLSPRMLQYRFLRATGITHNTVRQIERAKHAAALIVQGKPILDTVYEAGYFDQAHLTRSLKRFMGQTPMQMANTRNAETK